MPAPRPSAHARSLNNSSPNKVATTETIVTTATAVTAPTRRQTDELNRTGEPADQES